MFYLYNKISSIDKNVLICSNLTVAFVSLQTIALYDLNQLFLIIPITTISLSIYSIWDSANPIRTFSIVFIYLLLFWIFAQNLAIKTNANKLQVVYNFYQEKTFINLKESFLTNSNKIDHDDLPKIRNESDYNIFFVETNHNRNFFSPKQLCAIESAALNNPNAYVYVVSIRSEFNKTYLQNTYQNLILIRLMPNNLFKYTPLEKWWSQRRVFKSPYFYAHVSDAVRLALIWKYGGFYSDFDTITLKDLSPLRRYSGFGYLYENEPSLGNGFIHFKAQHQFIYKIMSEFVEKYSAFSWGDNGPTLIINTIKSYCNIKDLNKLLINEVHRYLNSYTDESYESLVLSTNRSDECDFGLYPQGFFYPYSYRDDEYKLVFKKNSQLDIKRLINSYSIHFYGKFSSKLRVNLNDFSLYDFLAMTQCKYVFKEIERNLKYFDD